jgi:hypothetical protein
MATKILIKSVAERYISDEISVIRGQHLLSGKAGVFKPL